MTERWGIVWNAAATHHFSLMAPHKNVIAITRLTYSCPAGGSSRLAIPDAMRSAGIDMGPIAACMSTNQISVGPSTYATLTQASSHLPVVKIQEERI